MKIYRFLTVSSIVLAGALLGACAQDDAQQAGQPAAGTASTAEPAGAVTAADLTGNPEQGKRYYILCQSCHSLNEGGMNKVGPNLHGIFGSPAAQVPGFIYSDALTKAGLVWDEATLDAWIARPAELVPYTTMVFAGIPDPQQRADLIAFLKQSGGE